jgi:hypothetical protein
MEKQNAGYANTDKQFEKIIRAVEEEGKAYNPIQPHLSVPSLWAFHKGIEPMMTDYDTFKRLKTEALGKRNQAFDGLDKTVKRIAAIAETAEVEPHILTEVITYKNSIDGTNVTLAAAKLRVETKKAEKAIGKGKKVEMPTKGRSVSQQAMSMRLSNFKLMVNSLKASSKYATNEEDMSVPALQAQYDNLNAANDAAIAAEKAWKNKLAERNILLAGETNSVQSLVKDVKKYLVGTKESKTSKVYKTISGVKFTNVKKE